MESDPNLENIQKAAEQGHKLIIVHLVMDEDPTKTGCGAEQDPLPNYVGAPPKNVVLGLCNNCMREALHG